MSATLNVYGGTLSFDEKKHFYRFNDAPVPGVTSILSVISKPALIQWSAGMASDYWLQAIKEGVTNYTDIHKQAKTAHRRKAKAAADSGTNVHEYAECFFKKLPLPELVTDEAKRGVEAFHKWLSHHTVEIIASERMVFSQKYYYCGTCDLVAKIDGEFTVGDIKTSSGIYPEMLLQTAAYQHALQEEMNVEFPVRRIIRFDKKTGEFETKEFRDFVRDFTGFKAALRLHKILQLIEGDK